MVLLQGRYTWNKKPFNCSLAPYTATPPASALRRRDEVWPGKLQAHCRPRRAGRHELSSQQRQIPQCGLEIRGLAPGRQSLHELYDTTLHLGNRYKSDGVALEAGGRAEAGELSLPAQGVGCKGGKLIFHCVRTCFSHSTVHSTGCSSGRAEEPKKSTPTPQTKGPSAHTWLGTVGQGWWGL